MGIPRAELLVGMSKLVLRLGGDPEGETRGKVVFFRGPERISIEVGPMPRARDLSGAVSENARHDSR